jgi:hypothetical protein
MHLPGPPSGAPHETVFSMHDHGPEPLVVFCCA